MGVRIRVTLPDRYKWLLHLSSQARKELFVSLLDKTFEDVDISQALAAILENQKSFCNSTKCNSTKSAEEEALEALIEEDVSLEDLTLD